MIDVFHLLLEPDMIGFDEAPIAIQRRLPRVSIPTVPQLVDCGRAAFRFGYSTQSCTFTAEQVLQRGLVFVLPLLLASLCQRVATVRRVCVPSLGPQFKDLALA